MFQPDLNAENLDYLLESFVEEGLIEPPILPTSEAEKKAMTQGIHQCLQFYFGTVEKGYHRVLEETKQRWNEIRVQEFTLSESALEQLKDPSELVKINQQHPTLQAYFHYSDDLVRDIFTIAVHLAERKEWDDAVAVLVFMVYLNPYIAECWENLGHCWEQTEQWGAAQFAYEKAIEAAPTNPQFYRSACQLLLEQKKYQRAKDILQGGLAFIQQQPASIKMNQAIHLLESALAYVCELGGPKRR